MTDNDRYQFVECAVLGFSYLRSVVTFGLAMHGLKCDNLSTQQISDPGFVVSRFRKMQFVQCLSWELLLRHFGGGQYEDVPKPYSSFLFSA